MPRLRKDKSKLIFVTNIMPDMLLVEFNFELVYLFNLLTHAVFYSIPAY